MFENLDPEIVKLIYVAAGFAAVALSSLINWKSSDPSEPFNAGKFLSAYVRSAWGLVPLALSIAASLGLSIEGLLAISAVAFGIDNGVKAAQNMGARKSGPAADGTPVSVVQSVGSDVGVGQN